MDPITTMLMNPEYHDILAIVKGFRNGVYTASMRRMHLMLQALFMVRKYVLLMQL